MTVALTMMVKDEAKVIRECLESALPFIDTWTILDTGSTDGTQDIVQETLLSVPGRLHHGDFVDFGTTRSHLMRLARAEADYLLLLDADTVIEYDKPELPPLALDLYYGTIHQRAIEFELPIIVRGDKPWRYQGVSHSYLACDDPYTEETLTGLVVVDKGNVTVEKLRRDLALLSAEHARNPLDARSAFYLAQTYHDLDMVPEAIAMYRLRANLAGWDEETFYARYRLGALLCEHVSFAQGSRELLAAWEMRPQRIEPLRVLAHSANGVADKAPRPPDRLFVHHAAYRRPA